MTFQLIKHQPKDVTSSAGVVRIIPINQDTLEELFKSDSDGESDEQLGRRLLKAVAMTPSDVQLAEGEFQRLTQDDLDLLADAAYRNSGMVPVEGVDLSPLVRLGLSARRCSTGTTVRDAIEKWGLRDAPSALAGYPPDPTRTIAQRIADYVIGRAEPVLAAGAEVPSSVAAAIAGHTAAMAAATASLRDTLADMDKVNAAQAIKENLVDVAAKNDIDRRLREVKRVEVPQVLQRPPMLDAVREQTKLAREANRALIDTAQRTATLNVHMATVSSEMSSISSLLVTEVIPAWRRRDDESRTRDIESRASATQALRVAVVALVATVVLTVVQIWHSRTDRAEDLQRLANEAKEAEQREKAAIARQQQAERDVATMQQLLRDLKPNVAGNAPTTAPRAPSSGPAPAAAPRSPTR